MLKQPVFGMSHIASYYLEKICDLTSDICHPDAVAHSGMGKEGIGRIIEACMTLLADRSLSS